MAYDVITIANKIANCYLVRTDSGFFMVDAGVVWQKGAIKRALKRAGCGKGGLKLVIITHGDWDHTGNAAYLQKEYGAKVIVHKREDGAVERGDMLSTRKTRQGMAFRMTLKLFKWLVFRSCKPDIHLENEGELTIYGIEAKIIHLPGHSAGSIGILTKEGDFFCGDLLTNSGKPEKNTLVDDEAEMDDSIERLKALNIKTVYPGHGKPFKMEDFLKN